MLKFRIFLRLFSILVNLFHIKEFLQISQIAIKNDSNNGINEWKYYIHVQSNVNTYPVIKLKKILASRPRT